MWAYPKQPGEYNDCIVCCVRENPEPILFKICCHGVRPELELDKKLLHFDRVLLHRYVDMVAFGFFSSNCSGKGGGTCGTKCTGAIVSIQVITGTNEAFHH